MPSFGKGSTKKIAECEEYLQIVANEVVKYFDFSVYEGHRTVEKQQEYFNAGKSQIDGIHKKSKHNYIPSQAFDCAPYPIDFNNTKRFYVLAGYMFMAEAKLKEQGKLPTNKKLRSGLDWDGDHDYDDSSFIDAPHYEVIDC